MSRCHSVVPLRSAQMFNAEMSCKPCLSARFSLDAGGLAKSEQYLSTSLAESSLRGDASLWAFGLEFRIGSESDTQELRLRCSRFKRRIHIRRKAFTTPAACLKATQDSAIEGSACMKACFACQAVGT